jgi:tetratricopeptide (TPR) repeat protein
MIHGDHYLRPSEAYPKAREYCEKALELDDSLSEAHSTLGFTVFQHYWDWPAAEREFKRAVELNPNDSWAQLYYAMYLVCMGRKSEGVKRAERALELDPLWLIAKAALGRILYFEDEYERSIAQLKRVLELDTDFVWALSWLAYALIKQNKFKEVLLELERRLSLTLNEPELTAILGHSYAVSGNKEGALDMLAKLQDQWVGRYVSPSLVALVYLGLGDRDITLRWLEKSFEDRSAYMPLDLPILVDPIWDSTRSDERFVSIMQKMKFS